MLNSRLLHFRIFLRLCMPSLVRRATILPLLPISNSPIKLVVICGCLSPKIKIFVVPTAPNQVVRVAAVLLLALAQVQAQAQVQVQVLVQVM